MYVCVNRMVDEVRPFLDSVGPLVQAAIESNVALAVGASVHNVLAGLDTEWDEAAEEGETNHGETHAAQVCAGTYFQREEANISIRYSFAFRLTI